MEIGLLPCEVLTNCPSPTVKLDFFDRVVIISYFIIEMFLPSL
jgi:hypothetical protein